VRRSTTAGVHTMEDLHNESMSALFEATVEATEEAIYNSLLKAETVTSNGRTVEALPIEATLEILRRYGVIPAEPRP
jgi:D-aminopeptidase